MNYIIATIGANITLGIITSVAAATNSAYSLANNISSTASTGSESIKLYIHTSDLENKIRFVQFLLHELKIDNNTPVTIKYCIYTIYDAINNICNELGKIKYRMEYNNNLIFGRYIRSYKFDNCQKRLDGHIKTLDKRYDALLNILKVQDKLEHKNLSDSMSFESPEFEKISIDKIKNNIKYLER